ncbi:MAG: hypothetical protein LBQ44_07325 [Treponema sp.]|jgi:hypothetical protein|nr:hypothetical protein [Treponema sp.]
MGEKAFITIVVYSLLGISVSLWGNPGFPQGPEKTLILGAAGGWTAAESRVQVAEVSSIRPHPVLLLSSAWTGDTRSGAAGAGQLKSFAAEEETLALLGANRNFPAEKSPLDLALNFDEADPASYGDSTGRYGVTVSRDVQAAGRRWARYGAGAALFTGNRGTPLRVNPRSRDALFTPGRSVRDFSLEFWLYPNTMENGEQILAWTAAGSQRIYCESEKNRLRWTFQDFFASPANPGRRLSIVLETRGTLVPRTWTHHLLRYNAGTGLLEYLVNGRLEQIAHVTSSGFEGGDVYTPHIDRDGAFILGGRYNGLIDEFRVYDRMINAPGRTGLDRPEKTALELPELAKFPRSGGRVETRTLDLGERGSRVLKLLASGGRYSPKKNTYAGMNNFRFPDNSALQFFIRSSEEPYRFASIPWTPVMPETELPPSIRGRYIQIAAAFYPSADCETTPYLEELRIVYDSNEPPYPPSLVSARGLNGAVELSWRASPDPDARGYLVYYGTSSGVYYGREAVQGESPINTGNRTSLRIEGLKNGTLYFFAVAAYDGSGYTVGELHPGKFSREVTARPLRNGE